MQKGVSHAPGNHWPGPMECIQHLPPQNSTACRHIPGLGVGALNMARGLGHVPPHTVALPILSICLKSAGLSLETMVLPIF